MSANADDGRQPDTEAVLQDETPFGSTEEPPVNVRAVGPTRVQVLPFKAASTIQVTVGTTPRRLFQADHRRGRTTVVSVGQNMYVAFNAAAAADVSRMALWPQNVPLRVTADSEVWVAAATATTVVSGVAELWATGEGGSE